MTSQRRIGAVAQASRSKIVVAVFGLAILLAGCSGTPIQVMVVGSILYSEGSFAASDDGTCNPAPNITEVKVETHAFDAFGDTRSDSTTGHIMSDGVVVGTGCWMAFETGSVEYHFSVTLTNGNCSWSVFTRDVAESMEADDPWVVIASPSRPRGIDVGLLDVGTLFRDSCRITSP